MAARFWAVVLAVRLSVAAGVAAWTGAIVGIPAAAAVGVALWLVVPVAAVAVSLAAARSHAPPGESPAGLARLLRVLCAEAWQVDIALLRMALEPLRARLDGAGPDTQTSAQVVLVHGIACNRAVWRPLLGVLHGAGIEQVHAVDLEPLFADIDTYARKLLARIEAVGASPARPVAIVAHSMGGLVARAALREAAPGAIGRIITVGTPHHGTVVARLFRWPSTRQMCRGSGWLLELNARQEGKLSVPMMSLYSLEDNLIVPADSAVLRGGRSIGLRGMGHLGLLRSPEVLRRIVSELRS